MTQIRLDKVVMTGLFEAWQNTTTVTKQVNITGTIPNGSGQSYEEIFSMPAEFSIADVYIESSLGKTYCNNSPPAPLLVYNRVSTETARLWIFYATTPSSEVVLNLAIGNNTGSSINLINQTLTFVVVFYRSPILIT